MSFKLVLKKVKKTKDFIKSHNPYLLNLNTKRQKIIKNIDKSTNHKDKEKEEQNH